MKRIVIVTGIVLVLVILKILITNPYQLSVQEQKKLKEITKGLLIEDFYVLIQEKNESTQTYKSISLMSLDEFNCEEDKAYICKKDDALLKIEEKKSYLEQAKQNKLIKTNGLKNDIDFFGSIKDSMNNNRIMESISNQISDHELQLFTLKNIPVNHSLDLISGDLDGYIMHPSSDTRYIYLTKNKKTYKITLKGLNYFNKTKIQELLNSIQIKG